MLKTWFDPQGFSEEVLYENSHPGHDSHNVISEELQELHFDENVFTKMAVFNTWFATQVEITLTEQLHLASHDHRDTWPTETLAEEGLLHH